MLPDSSIIIGFDTFWKVTVDWTRVIVVGEVWESILVVISTPKGEGLEGASIVYYTILNGKKERAAGAVRLGGHPCEIAEEPQTNVWTE